MSMCLFRKGISGLLGAFVIGCGLSVAAPAASAQTLEEIRSRGSVNFGVRIDTPRFGGLNPATNEITGFEIDIAQAISDELLGEVVSPNLIPVTSQNRIAQLSTGRVDILIATITITQPRMNEVEFSNVYLRAGQSLLVRSDSDIASYEDLPGRTVCTVVGSTPEQTIRRVVPEAEVATFNTYPECLVSLLNGRVDAVTTGITLLRDMQESNPDTTKIVGDLFTFEAWGLAVRKGDTELIAAINDALMAIKDSGQYAEIYEKWMGEAPPEDIESWYGMAPEEAARLFAESSPQ